MSFVCCTMYRGLAQFLKNTTFSHCLVIFGHYFWSFWIIFDVLEVQFFGHFSEKFWLAVLFLSFESYALRFLGAQNKRCHKKWTLCPSEKYVGHCLSVLYIPFPCLTWAQWIFCLSGVPKDNFFIRKFTFARSNFLSQLS